MSIKSQLIYWIKDRKDDCIFWIRRFFSLSQNKVALIVGSIAFILTFISIFLTLEKISTIKHLKAEIIQLQKDLNAIGWDISYEHLSFNTLTFSSIMTVKDLSFYHTEHNFKVAIPKLSVKTQLFSFSKFDIIPSETITLSTGEKNWPIKTKHTNIEIEIKDNKVAKLLAELSDINIKNTAHIQTVNIAGRHTNNTLAINGPTAVFENHLDIQNIKISHNTNIPLSKTINRLYLKTDTIEDSQKSASLNISNLIIDWSPFSLVGKGEFYITSTGAPNLLLETSSKGLLNLLNHLQEQNIVERKGIFVANIILTNKAFKLKDEDTELTIITPIAYKDKNLTIENISIRKF